MCMLNSALTVSQLLLQRAEAAKQPAFAHSQGQVLNELSSESICLAPGFEYLIHCSS